MSKQLRELQARKTTLVKEARSLTDRVAADSRDMSDEEVVAFDALRTRIDAASAAIDREAALIADEARISVSSAIGPIVTDNREADPKRGFGSLGEFMQAVYQADKPGKSIDGRLLLGGLGGMSAAAPANFSNEAAGQDGGFLVPPQFSQEIFKLSLGEDSLLPLTDNVEISGNSMAFPKDETTPWGTNGIRAYWQGEAASAIATKPVLGLATLRLKKLMALVPTTDELLDDANALTTYLPQASLAAIVIVAGTSLFDLATMRWLWRVRRSELVLCLVALLGVAIVGVLQGIVIAIVLSLLAFLQRVWRPHDATLGRVPGRHGYHDVARHPDARQIPGMLIFRFDAPVFFANAEHFSRCVKKHVAERGEPVRHVVIAGEPITDIDTTGAESLRDLIDDLAKGHVTLAFAEIKGPVKDRLRSYGAYRDIGKENFYSTVGHAVTEYLEEAGGDALEWVDDYDGTETTPKG